MLSDFGEESEAPQYSGPEVPNDWCRHFDRVNVLSALRVSLSQNLARFAISPDSIPTSFNIFMNVEIDSTGKMSILPPRSKAGDANHVARGDGFNYWTNRLLGRDVE